MNEVLEKYRQQNNGNHRKGKTDEEKIYGRILRDVVSNIPEPRRHDYYKQASQYLRQFTENPNNILHIDNMP